MSLILGLDLGTASIGWAVIKYGSVADDLRIVGLGVRIVQMDGDTQSRFTSGQAIEVNAMRTAKRTARKMLDRYQMRREDLRNYFSKIGVSQNPDLEKLPQLELWALRSAAAERKVELDELLRVLLHINQKRGYNASKADLAEDKESGKGYVADVRNRYIALQNTGQTVGQFYYSQLRSNPNYRVKGTDKVLPRAAYRDEVLTILRKQAEYYPEVLTSEAIDYIIDYIMFYQRPLKSCKHLVGECQRMKREILTADGKAIVVGPKVAHKSNPLFEESRIWQAINNLTLTKINRHDENYILSKDEKQRLYNHLQKKPKLTISDINTLIFNKKKNNEWKIGLEDLKWIPGNRTLQALTDALDGKYDNLLKFDLNIIENVDKTTGEVHKVVDANVIYQPLYRLWHTIYSISDVDELKNALRRNFNIEDDDVLDALASIDFAKSGYGNLSVKAIRKILPYLMDGNNYADACDLAGFRHSDYMTNDENAARELAKHITSIKKGDLRQPIVEKILNQVVNVVNALKDKYGDFDEIHIELARELQQSREERQKTSQNINKNERENKALANLLENEYHLSPTRGRITKLKLWEENSHKCMYCDSPVNAKEFFEGINYEVEHIIPKSLLFDDSFSNKVCACRKCNHEKNNLTAYDYIKAKGEKMLESYLNRVNALQTEGKISKAKLRNLTMTEENIPDDFINRQLRQSQYIAKKAKDMMAEICHVVVPTSGTVTAFLRNIWGWNTVLHDLNYDMYARNAELIDESTHRIKDWDKRVDHRHHAIDALTIACTSPAIIQRLNNLSSLKDVELPPYKGKTHSDRLNRVERYALSMPHFSTGQVADAASQLLISMKPASKLTTPGKRRVHHGRTCDIVQTGICIPRGPLHEETVHGMISRYDKNGKLTKVTVTKRPLTSFTSEKDAASIVDKHIRDLVIERLKSAKDKKSAFAEPLYSDKAGTQAIKSVRCFTNLTTPIPLRFDDNGNPIAFVKAGSNHHLALYLDESGVYREHVVTFMHAVERAKRHLPTIITTPAEVWSKVIENPENYSQSFLSMLPEDKWQFVMSMQRNEMFVLGMSDDEFDSAIKNKDYQSLCKHLYRVQKLSMTYYVFSYHTQTQCLDDACNKPDKRFIRVRSHKALFDLNPKKIDISILGEIKS